MYPEGTGLVTQGRALKLSQNMQRCCLTLAPPPLEMEGETFALQCKGIHSVERKARSLGFYNHLECKQRALGLGRREAFSIFVAMSLSVALKGLDRAGTQKSRNGCLPATYTTKEGFRCI